MSRADLLKRQRALLWLLEGAPEGLTTAELCTELGVSERTARRDLLALRAAGYPLTTAASRWRFVEGQALPSALAADGAGEVAERDKVMVLDAALRGRRALRASYTSTRDPAAVVAVRLAPRALRYVEGSLFVVAREHPRGRLRTFAVERLGRLERLPGRSRAEPEDSLERYLEEGFPRDAARELIRVAVLFDPSAAWRVEERIWHPSQRIYPQPDGGAVATLRVAGFAWARAWVLGFGPEATVVEPPELVRLVCEDLDAARSRYCQIADLVPQLDLFK